MVAEHGNTTGEWNTDKRLNAIAETPQHVKQHTENCFDEQQIDVGPLRGWPCRPPAGNPNCEHCVFTFRDSGRCLTETTDSHNFQMLEQSWEDELKFDAPDLDDSNRSRG